MKTKPFIRFFLLPAIVLLCGGLFTFYVLAQQQEPIVESVSITNVEVPVRVLDKDKPVTDLKKEDFNLFEDNKKVQINGFYLKRKQINVTTTEETGSQQLAIAPKPRVFVLTFSITDFNENLRQAIDHLFNNVLRKEDRLMLLVNEKTLEYKNLEDRDKIKNELLSNLREESQTARKKLLKYINYVETYLNVHDFKTKVSRRDEPADRLIQFLQKYLVTWKDYKNNYLTPRTDRFYYFARYLEKIKAEKWVLNFYQFELFPNIKIGSNTYNIIRDTAQALIETDDAVKYGQGKNLLNLVSENISEMNVGGGFPVEDISKLFYKVDATFHSFYIKSTVSRGKDDLDYQEISSDVEKILKDITRVTGGENITSNDLVKSIDTVSTVEDAYYMLTYVPSNPKKAGKIKITLNNKKFKLLYDNNFREDYITTYLANLEKTTQTPTVKITDFSFKDKTLAFTIKDFVMQDINKVKSGILKVRIRLTDKDSRMLFDQEKILTAQKKELTISLNTFKTITPGEYTFILDATDAGTGKEANSINPFVVK